MKLAACPKMVPVNKAVLRPVLVASGTANYCPGSANMIYIHGRRKASVLAHEQDAEADMPANTKGPLSVALGFRVHSDRLASRAPADNRLHAAKHNICPDYEGPTRMAAAVAAQNGLETAARALNQGRPEAMEKAVARALARPASSAWTVADNRWVVRKFRCGLAGERVSRAEIPLALPLLVVGGLRSRRCPVAQSPVPVGPVAVSSSLLQAKQALPIYACSVPVMRTAIGTTWSLCECDALCCSQKGPGNESLRAARKTRWTFFKLLTLRIFY